MAPLFEDTEAEEPQKKTIRQLPSLWRKLRAIAKVERRSLNNVVGVFLTWAIEDWRKETTAAKQESYRQALAQLEAAAAAGEQEEDEDEELPTPPKAKRAPKK